MNLAAYYFHQGTNFWAYKYLGATLVKKADKFEYTFRVWAPNADTVGLISDFSGWNEAVPLSKVTEKGVWELKYVSERSLEACAYKYRITSNGKSHDKGDPYAAFSRGKDDGASVIFCESSFSFTDENWLLDRKKTVTEKAGVFLSAPLNIYEMHFGSFIRHSDNSYYSYREMAEILPSYLKAMGYTHVEFLPLSEHPYDGSWGYQICAFYAPTSRFGTPLDLKYLINELHKVGIGVIMDWVPAHFPKDEWGLYEFDGSPIYEYQGMDRQQSNSWGTHFFDLGREEVQSFLISNALYYFREFHIDGLRVDAVASMLYLDYDRSPCEWVPNSEGTNINLEAVAFLKKLNCAVFTEYPDALMIAEESGSFGKITSPVFSGGLGFNMKWNMGWANDFYEYVKADPVYRKELHKALNFPLMYAFSENYCMPISHDEVVHGKGSFINKMFGNYEDKFWTARTSLMLMMTYPSKKLLFMGTEYGQFREWDYENSLEWFMLDYPTHRHFREYTRALNHFYLSHSELWDMDFDPRGFSWILVDEADKNLVAFRRYNREGESLIVLLSFSGCDEEILLPTNKAKELTVVFDTGNITDNNKRIKVEPSDGSYFAKIKIPRLSGMIMTENDGSEKIKL